MPACISISRFFAIAFLLVGLSAHAQAPDPTQPGISQGAGPSVPSGHKEDANLFDQPSPYLEYGDFNSNEDEDADTLYYQYGRFFGVSLGLGYQTATGNRGLLYEAAIPRVDLKVHYWFDFQLAMDLGVFFANHSFNYGGTNYAEKLIGYEVDIKYYFDVKNASAPLTFANPFLVFGAGEMSKNETTVATSTTPTSDSTFTLGLGGGFEFPISYRKTYFILEGKYNTQSFNDSSSNNFRTRVPDLNGGFFSLMGHIMFTW